MQDELVDLVDVSGSIQKRNIPRSEVHIYPDLYLQIIIAVVFDKDGRVLVHKRARTKKVNPGDIDHICGGVMSGETPEQAAVRESTEETGVTPIDLRIVVKGVNKYNRFRYLLVGHSDDEPLSVNTSEVEWVAFMHPDILKVKQASGEFTFVDEFFQDTDVAIEAL